MVTYNKAHTKPKIHPVYIDMLETTIGVTLPLGTSSHPVTVLGGMELLSLLKLSFLLFNEVWESDLNMWLLAPICCIELPEI